MLENQVKTFFRKLIGLLQIPETRGIDLDSKDTGLLHSKIIHSKPLLKDLYRDFYLEFKSSIPDSENKIIVELGSGGGFIKEVIPNAITSDIIKFPGIDMQFSALKIPFDNNSLDAILMADVLHHLGDVRMFFKEANRCLKPSGKIVMIEPSSTPFGKFCNKHMHHEDYNPSEGWEFDVKGRMCSTNLAIPWIVFFRDRSQFEEEFPSLKITKLRHHMPFRYLISGGLSTRQLLPSFTKGVLKGIEKILCPLNDYIGMFLTVELTKSS
jgi:SAM-dependent methyltransferase